MKFFDQVFDWIGHRIASGLTPRAAKTSASRPSALERALQPADVLFVAEGRKISTAFKTQSTWSQAALCTGGAVGPPAGGEEPRCLIEVEVVRNASPSPVKYATFNTRICRLMGLSEEERWKVVRFMGSWSIDWDCNTTCAIS